MTQAINYIRDGEEIYQRSFEIIRKESDIQNLTQEMQQVAMRLIHACGMVDVINDMEFSENCVAVAKEALQNAKPIFCDVEMVKAGIIRKFLKTECEIICSLNDERTKTHAQNRNTTRCAAGVNLWEKEKLHGSIVVVGNAPTALFHLAQRIAEENVEPAVIVAMPVGFVGAVESKKYIMEMKNQKKMNSEVITIHGRRGGAALACATINALAKMRNKT